MVRRISRWTSFHTGIGILALGLATVGWVSSPPAHPDREGETADCLVNISAANRGTADIWVMLYDSKVRRRWGGITWETWKKLEIQNHRVAPGATIKRSHTTPGRCDVERQWRWVLKRGSNSYTYDNYTEVKPGTMSISISLGDLNRFF